ncbi:MAG: LamG domain-containing protein [Chthoniobacterales bacterium]
MITNRLHSAAGFLLITFALSWIGLSPTARGADPSMEGGYPNPNFFSRPYRDVIMADNPIMYWRLGELAGTLAYDETSQHRDAIYVGNPTLGIPGAILEDANTATGFNGHNQYVTWNPTASVSGTFTVEAWVKEGKLYQTQTFVNTRSTAADYSFDLKFELVTLNFVQKQIHFDIGDGRRWLAVGGLPFDFKATVWYHVAAVVTPTRAVYYVDGVKIGSASYTGTPLLCDFAHKVEIGTNTASGWIFNQVQSVIDEVAIYDYALTADQIAAHHVTGEPPGE